MTIIMLEVEVNVFVFIVCSIVGYIRRSQAETRCISGCRELSHQGFW